MRPRREKLLADGGGASRDRIRDKLDAKKEVLNGNGGMATPSASFFFLPLLFELLLSHAAGQWITEKKNWLLRMRCFL